MCRYARFLDGGHICLTINAGGRALLGIALGRKSWLFASSDRGGERAAVMYTLIGTAKLNDVDARLGSPTTSIASPICLRPGCTSSCPGTGTLTASRPSPHSLRPTPDAYERRADTLSLSVCAHGTSCSP